MPLPIARLTGEQAEAWNAFLRLFRQGMDWKAWVADFVATHLVRSVGAEVRLTAEKLTDPNEPPREETYRSTDVIRLGASPAAPQPELALLHVDGDGLILESLSDQVTDAAYDHLPRKHPLQPGERFAIYPYRYSVVHQQRFEQLKITSVAPIPPRHVRWHEFVDAAPIDAEALALHLAPVGSAWIELDGSLLDRLYPDQFRSVGIRGSLDPKRSRELLRNYLCISLAEAFNRALTLNGHLRVAQRASNGSDDGIEAGITVEFPQFLSTIRFFLPNSMLTRMATAARLERKEHPVDAKSIAATYWISPGYADLSAAEVEDLRLGDIAFFEAGDQLLPANSWNIDGLEYQRTSKEVFVESSIDRDKLLIRMHVILVEKELSYEELTEMQAGAIYPLGALDADTPVKLAFNGRILAEGKLIYIDDRLGVEILAWRSE